ncbi:glycosyltransferase family 2 protein [Paeniglutamicibacter gangotriensis]|uniref:Glycosyltransferase family 2 protein n=1 Tax=Paeniglutamicibacter gangotriensis TaxID=254787 RepID=A0A5B0EJQ4_9MICC|nr:glycosyltransferase family 2 protein [Paeniglutamicibacter gangotriensis]KAA0977549.1 glycosyltransferase family 2 protein [Paeniglutamicibacter gangotriensis]
MTEHELHAARRFGLDPREIQSLTTTRVVPFNREIPQPSLVSVVIPCFNYEDYLPSAVNSAISQVGVRTEVIIVDDRSTDRSLEVAKKLVAMNSNVTVLEHKVNRGPVETFNDGLAAASGEFLVRLDADDLLTPGSLRRAVRVLQDHSNIGMIYGRPLHFSGSKLPSHRQTASKVTLWPGLEWLERRCQDGLNVITSPEVVMRKSLVDLVGGQMPLAHTHDMEMWLRIAAFSDVAYLRGCDQAWHRDHEMSLSARLVDLPTDLEERRKAFETLFSGIAADKPWVPRLRERAARALDEACVSLACHELDRRVPDSDLVNKLLRQLSGGNSNLYPTVKRIQSRIGQSKSTRSKTMGLFRRLRDRARADLSRIRWSRYGEY